MARVCHGALRLSRDMRQWATPSVLLRLLEQAILILRECLSDQALVPSGGTLFRLCQHGGGWAPEPTRSVGGMGGMQFALITGERRRAPGWQEHAVAQEGKHIRCIAFLVPPPSSLHFSWRLCRAM